MSRIAIGRPIQRTCSISGVVTPKRFPKSMCERLIWLGTFDMRTVPNAKNVVNTMPIAVSGRTIWLFLTCPTNTTVMRANTSAPTR